MLPFDKKLKQKGNQRAGGLRTPLCWFGNQLAVTLDCAGPLTWKFEKVD